MTSSNWISVRVLGAGTEGRELNTFNQPRGVVFDSSTREIFVTDCNNHRIQVFQYDTLAFVRQIGKGNQGSGPGQMNYSVGICIDNGCRVYVADTNNHRISIFNRVNGEFIKNIGSLGSTPGLFNSPYGVAVDNQTGKLC
jgi:DNA-binding beta-propeller fold protein YncE